MSNGAAAKARVKLDDHVWRALKSHLNRNPRGNVRVGVLASKGGNAKHDESGIRLAELMAIHEYGSPKAGIPERAPLRTFVKRKRKQLSETMRKLAEKIVMRKLSVDAALEILGAFAAAEAKKTITADRKLEPPLKPATVSRKGSDRPLVDTGQLVNAINWELE